MKMKLTRPLTFPKAFKIGLFQVIAMVPGVSRSAATIIGGLSQKLTRKNAAEFSFFLAVPTMFAATVLSIYKFYTDGFTLSSAEINTLDHWQHRSICIVALIVAIKSFISFLTKHGFKMYSDITGLLVGITILALYYLGEASLPLI
jgi:undecaprenyl-diphosphatase